MVPIIASALGDDGYSSPDFDLPSDSEDDLSDPAPPSKRTRTLGKRVSNRAADMTLEQEEETALQLLRRRK